MPLTKDHFERCNELRQWCLSHSGERPRRRSDDKTEASLAIWLERALIRRTGVWSDRPSTRQLTASETAHLNSIVRATVTPPQVGHAATTSKLDTKSSWRVLRERCRELGLTSYGDKQAVLARILNEENSLTTDQERTAVLARVLSQVKDSDNDQEMLGTFRDTESLPPAMPCQHRQTEIIAETPFKRPRTLTPTLNSISPQAFSTMEVFAAITFMAAKHKDEFERCKELREWYLNHSGERPRRRSDDKTETSLANWLDTAVSRRARSIDSRPSHRQLTAKDTLHLNNIMATATGLKDDCERFNELKQWWMNHSAERPRRNRLSLSDPLFADYGNWVKMARQTCRTQSWPGFGRWRGRCLTATEQAQLKDIMQRPPTLNITADTVGGG
jgi:hypothetical protein